MAPLKALLWNCRSASNKIIELTALSKNYDLIVLTETWLNANNHLNLPNFNIIRKDRQHRNGGGLAILIRSGLSWHTCNNAPELPSAEILTIKITSLQTPITLITCYRPPTHHLNLTQWENFFKATSKLGVFFLMGDFNALHPTWNCNTTNPTGEILHRLINKHNLIIHNTDTQSHISHNQRKNSNLDLILSQTDIAHFITTQQLEDMLGSDHYPIECTLNTEKHVYQKKTNRLSTTNTNWNEYKKDMDSLYFNHFLGPDFSEKSPVDKYEDFVNKMIEFTKANTPSRPIKTKRSNPVPWWDTECNQAIRLRKASLKKWLHTHNFGDWTQYKKQTAVARKLLKKKKREAFKDFASKLNHKSDPAHLWNTIKRLKSKWTNTNHQTHDKPLQDTYEQAAVNKICPPWVPDSPTTGSNHDQSHLFLDQPFNYTELIVALDKCKLTAAPGPDRIDYTMIKSLSDKCKLLFLDILNELYQSRIFPEAWKKVHIFLISKHNSNSLRPITLSSCVCKIMERLLNHRLMWWVEHNGVLPHFQSGFKKGRSCSDNIGTLITTADTEHRTNKYTAAIFPHTINSAHQ